MIKDIQSDYYNTGITAGVFDLLHVGHLSMLKQMKRHCNNVVVCVQADPSLYRKDKAKPVESLYERVVRLKSCVFVDEVIPYESEKDLEDILRMYDYDIRFIGQDHQGKPFTGDKIRTETHYFNGREHNHSSTNLKRRIVVQALTDKMKEKGKNKTKSFDEVKESLKDEGLLDTGWVEKNNSPTCSVS